MSAKNESKLPKKKHIFTEEQDVDPKATKELLRVLSDLTPKQLKSLSEYDSKIKHLVEKLELARAEQCLEALKEIAYKNYPRQSILARIYAKSSELFGFKNFERETLKAYSPYIKSLDFSTDPYLLDDPNSVLIQLPIHCSEVRSVNLNSCSLTIEGLKALQSLPSIENLSLSFCEFLTKEMLQIISQLPLRGLKLSWNKKLPLSHFSYLKKLSQLEHLDISHTNITDEEMETIASLKTLCDLNLDGCSLLSDEGIKKLKNILTLQSLNLSSCALTDSLLSKFDELFPNLLSLTLRNNNFSDASVAMLSNLKELFYLDLSWSKKLDGSCLTVLSKLPQLHVLDISRSDNLDPCHPAWQHFENLLILNLSRLTLSRKTLQYVSKIPNLMRLNLSFCEGFHEEDLVFLTKLNELKFLDLSHSPISSKVHALFSKKATIKV